jgi:hypothetical protein
MVAELEGFSLFGGRRSRKAGRKLRGGKGIVASNFAPLNAGGVEQGILCPPGQPHPRVAALSNGLTCAPVRGGRKSRRRGTKKGMSRKTARKAYKHKRKSRRGGTKKGMSRKTARKAYKHKRKSRRGGRKSYRGGGCGCANALVGGRKRKGRKSRKSHRRKRKSRR